MSLPRISLQALEAFERLAANGSMQTTAADMQLSISSVSHHIARLEDQLGVALFDRATRPFALTRDGQQTLDHVVKGLSHLRRATDETAVSGLLRTRSLRIGIVEEFESTVTPELAAFLANHMPQATLSISNVLSHAAPRLLTKGEIDLAVVSDVEDNNLISLPLLRDPYVAAMSQGTDITPTDALEDAERLAFLRFNQTHLIGKQIEAHLARNRIDLPSRFMCDSVQSIMAIVAGGAGWSIVTPLGFMRAQRFAETVRLHPLPLPAFGRKIVLATRGDFDDPTRHALANLLRQIIARVVVAPACAAYPWLNGALSVEDEPRALF